MSAGSLLCWLAWGAVLRGISPLEAGWGGFAFFYLSLFLALLGTFSVVVFLIRRRLLEDDAIIFRHVKQTFQQSVIAAMAIIVALILLGKDLLHWWNGIMLLLLVIGLEALMTTHRDYRNNEYVS